MKNVAIMLQYSNGWIGGVNYINNVLHALSIRKEKNIDVILFAGRRHKEDIQKMMLGQYTKTIYSYQFDNKEDRGVILHLLFRLYKLILLCLFRINYLNYLVIKNKISLFINPGPINLSPSRCKVINWIPDFQHLHLRKMFSEEEVRMRNSFYMKTIINSDRIILSSMDAYGDYKKFAPSFVNKAKVIRFATHIDGRFLKSKFITILKQKYNINNKFFYVPNQFWQHKNYEIVFKALAIAKKKEKNILVICSGYMYDYRNQDYIKKIKKMIQQLNIDNNIKLLGIIDYEDVISLMRTSIAVINPSFFEGWSTTVEEAKSLGKLILLSDIPVHHEQNPSDCFYFNPLKEQKLARALLHIWKKQNNGLDINREQQALLQAKRRINKFGQEYFNVISEVLNEK